MDEKILLTLLKQGEEKAFDRIFEKYAREIYFFSLDLTKSDQQAEEIVQDVMLKVWETRSSIDTDRNFTGYLLTIAKNIIYNSFKRKLIERRFAERSDPPESPESIEQKLIQDDLRKLLLSGIENLTTLRREVVLMKVDGYTNDEIAAKLSISKKSVENHLFKACRQLRVDLGNFRDVFRLFLSLTLPPL